MYTYFGGGGCALRLRSAKHVLLYIWWVLWCICVRASRHCRHPSTRTSSRSVELLLPPWCLASPRLRLFSSPISTVVADVTHAVRYSLGMTGWTKMVAVVSVERTVAAVVAARWGADHGHDMCERWTIELTCETRTIWINTRQEGHTFWV